MVSNDELLDLIERARGQGAKVDIQHDQEALLKEGRVVVNSVSVTDLPGVSGRAMGPVEAGEALRDALARKSH